MVLSGLEDEAHLSWLKTDSVSRVKLLFPLGVNGDRKIEGEVSFVGDIMVLCFVLFCNFFKIFL